MKALRTAAQRGALRAALVPALLGGFLAWLLRDQADLALAASLLAVVSAAVIYRVERDPSAPGDDSVIQTRAARVLLDSLTKGVVLAPEPSYTRGADLIILDSRLSEEDRWLVFAHEFIHLKHRDNSWFNPAHAVLSVVLSTLFVMNAGSVGIPASLTVAAVTWTLSRWAVELKADFLGTRLFEHSDWPDLTKQDMLERRRKGRMSFTHPPAWLRRLAVRIS